MPPGPRPSVSLSDLSMLSSQLRIMIHEGTNSQAGLDGLSDAWPEQRSITSRPCWIRKMQNFGDERPHPSVDS